MHEGGDPAYDEAAVWPDCEPELRGGPAGERRSGELRCQQGGSHWDDQVPGSGVGRPRHYGQRCGPRLYQHGYDCSPCQMQPGRLCFRLSLQGVPERRRMWRRRWPSWQAREAAYITGQVSGGRWAAWPCRRRAYEQETSCDYRDRRCDPTGPHSPGELGSSAPGGVRHWAHHPV